MEFNERSEMSTARCTWNPTCYIGVDLIEETITVVARDPEYVRDAYTLIAEHSPALDGVIFLSTEDQSFNGRRALAIALDAKNQDIGLGWRFMVRDSEKW